jgi:hypothetical protein
MDAELLIVFIVWFFGSILMGAIGLILSSSLVMQYLPNTRLAKWLESIWIDPEEKPDDIFNAKAGDCIRPRNK